MNASYLIPAIEGPFEASITLPGSPEAGSILIGVVRVDHDFRSTLEVDLVAGREAAIEARRRPPDAGLPERRDETNGRGPCPGKTPCDRASGRCRSTP